MKPFIFKLQTALDIKLKEEDLARETLAERTKEYNQHLEFLGGLIRRLVGTQEALRKEQQDMLDLNRIKRYQEYLPVAEEQIKHQEAATEGSLQEMEQARLRLIETMKDRKMMEKLKEKHYQEYLAECRREEQKQIDEMAAIRYFHRDSAV